MSNKVKPEEIRPVYATNMDSMPQYVATMQDMNEYQKMQLVIKLMSDRMDQMSRYLEQQRAENTMR